MRIFVAAELDEKVRQSILEVVGELSSRHKDGSFVSQENLHFTLKFLGDVDESRLNDVISSIEQSIAGIMPFRLHVRGLGYFGSRQFAKVVWVGTHEGRDSMIELSKRLDSNLSKFREDEQEPSPHITICRPRGQTSELIADVEAMKSRDFDEMEVKGVVLKKSTLTPKGAVYEDIKTFTLCP